ncbi:hypothetical protein E2C01_099862 [Portunus trituberculatus]|uniref:Uncharacterized protein n=1 Tax=Portunus trituberculatus TaxID=210409 RepID=A0A5B7KFY4_PORTR|nr:hypothetical protein [Portunus trituberculatus]
MMGAHSRPPNPTSDYSHLQKSRRDPNASIRAATTIARTHEKMQPNQLHFSQNNNPLFYSHGLTSNKPATQTGGHDSQADD